VTGRRTVPGGRAAGERRAAPDRRTVPGRRFAHRDGWLAGADIAAVLVCAAGAVAGRTLWLAVLSGLWAVLARRQIRLARGHRRHSGE